MPNDVINKYGRVAELVYAYASEAYGAILEGSNPSAPTIMIGLILVLYLLQTIFLTTFLYGEPYL